jgi:hypothetical protein
MSNQNSHDPTVDASDQTAAAVHLTDIADEMATLVDVRVDTVADATASKLPPFATHNVVVAFDDSMQAREALLALERAGIDGSKLSYLGIEPSADQTIDERTSELDNAELSFVARGTAKGGTYGTIGGAAIGGALMLIPGIGTIAGAGILGAALGGGAFGGVLGGIWGGFNRMGASQAWDEVFHDIEEGLVLVGVHTDDPEEIRRACDVLPTFRRRMFDHQGQTVDDDAEGSPVGRR